MSERRFHKGDIVSFQLGTRWVQGTIVEDRGPIGVNGRRLYRVEFRVGPQSESVSHAELPAASLESSGAGASR
jgi:hypothetical protein